METKSNCDQKQFLIDELNMASVRLQKGFDAVNAGTLCSEAWQVLQQSVQQSAVIGDACAHYLDAAAGTREAWHAPGYRPTTLAGWVAQLRYALSEARNGVRPETLEACTRYLGKAFINAEASVGFKRSWRDCPGGPGPVAKEPKTDCDEDEEMIQDVIEVIRKEQCASVSLIQRRMRLGYTRAARIMDELERRRIVGHSKGAEPRDILIVLDRPAPVDPKVWGPLAPGTIIPT